MFFMAPVFGKTLEKYLIRSDWFLALCLLLPIFSRAVVNSIAL